MKKTVLITKLIFWMAFLIFMIAMVTKVVISSKTTEKLIQEVSAAPTVADIAEQLITTIDAPWERRLTWLIWFSGGFMFLAFTMLEMNSLPSPKLEPNRRYILRGMISHNYKDHTIVLAYDDNVELFRCRYAKPLASLELGREYTVKKINGDLIFTS